MTTPRQPPKSTREDKIDRQMKDSFPASDPPSFSGGNHIVGAPEGRKSSPPRPGDANVKAAAAKAEHKKAAPRKRD
jgi:hypothetical protein